MAHPPPPWRLRGELIIVPARVGRSLGGVLLANYTGGTLAYRELIVFSHATPRGMVVSHIYVDDERSLSGGREIWALPKELATFTYTRTRFEADGLLTARIRRRPGVIALTIPAPIVSDAGATLGIARIKAAPALVTIESARFAHLNGTHLALAGDDLDLTMPAPT
jgi:hypothetical protein